MAYTAAFTVATAQFSGSMAGIKVDALITGIVPTADGRG